MGPERLIATPNEVSALRVTCWRGRLHFGPVNHIEMRYEIVEGSQNGSGVWLDNGSIRFEGVRIYPCENGSLVGTKWFTPQDLQTITSGAF